MELGLVCFRNTGKEGTSTPLFFVVFLLSTQALLLERDDEFGTLET